MPRAKIHFSRGYQCLRRTRTDILARGRMGQDLCKHFNARTTCHTVWTLNREADIDIQLNSKGSYPTRPLTCLSLRTEYLYVLLQNNTTLVCLNSTRQKTLFGQAPNLPDYDVIQVPQKSTLTAEDPIIAISSPAAGASRSTWCHVHGRRSGEAIAPVRDKLSVRRVDMLMD